MTASRSEIIFRLASTPDGNPSWSKIERGTAQYTEAMTQIARESQLTNASIFAQTAQSKLFNELRSKSAAQYNKTYTPKLSQSWVSSMFTYIASAFSRIRELASNLFKRQISVK